MFTHKACNVLAPRFSKNESKKNNDKNYMRGQNTIRKERLDSSDHAERLFWQLTTGKFGETRQGNFPGLNRAVREFPGRVPCYTCRGAERQLALAVGSGALDIRQEFCGRAEHCFLALAMRAPESPVEKRPAILDASGKRIK